MDNIKLAICVDDVNPSYGWGQISDECISLIRELHDEFGCKFTFFVPANFRGATKLRDNIEWVDYWKNCGWVELAAHGYYHDTEIDSCEFTRLNQLQTMDRITKMLDEWKVCNYFPTGFRPPGWGFTQITANELYKCGFFKYFALHPSINDSIIIPSNIDVIKITGLIHEKNVFQDTTIIHAHIHGSWNKNVISRENIDNIKKQLVGVKFTPIFMREI